MRLLTLPGCLSLTLAFVLADTKPAEADELRVHGSAAAAHAVGDPQASEFGFGGAGTASLEVVLARQIGLQVELGGLVLASGDAPLDARFRAHDVGALFTGMLGLRFRPFATYAKAGLWLDVNGGLGFTGNLTRGAFDAHIGYDFRIRDASRLELGPMFGFVHVLQPNDTPRPEDANVLLFGIHVGLGEKPKAELVAGAPRNDRDADGIVDEDDICPNVAGVRTNDPLTNGCPRPDRDKDGIADAEDSCPDTPGIRTDDPRTNGCPRLDRDKDGVFDDEDACPDTPGVRTADPKTNGCPLPDRDNDGVPDEFDACPDLPGVATNDAKTNGCPPASGAVRVVGDRIVLDDIILFDLDSPRVRHASWPAVKKVADFINANPDIIEVDIDGHADQSGTEEHNLRLSKTRAESVKKLLIYFGVDPVRVSTSGLGKSRPKSQGMSEEERRQNRRVEFTITRARAAPSPAKANPSPTTSPTDGGGR